MDYPNTQRKKHLAAYICSLMGLDYNKNTTIAYCVYKSGYEGISNFVYFKTRELVEKYVATCEKIKNEDDEYLITDDTVMMIKEITMVDS